MESSPLEKFYQWELTAPARIFLRQPVEGRWIDYSFANAAKEIRAVAKQLRKMNIPAGSNIAILSKNCAHWVMADLAIWMAGHVSVPIYPSLSASSVEYVLNHCDAKAIFIGKLDNYNSQQKGISRSIHKISFPLYGPQEDFLWSEMICEDGLKESFRPDRNSLATIIYSSGTTGTPKGVMLTHAALDFFGRSSLISFNIDKNYNFFSYLPMAHIAERAYIEIVALYSGSTIAFAESLDKFAQNLGEIKPVIFGGVPRIYSKFQEAILSKIPQKKLDRLLSIPIVSVLLKLFVKRKLGLSKAKIIGCGAAPISIALLEWYRKLDIKIQELYGMTENCGYSHGDHGDLFKFGTVGRAWKDVEYRIGGDGEILLKHGGMMSGYYKDKETTNKVFTDDGFLKTGDKGTVDSDGFLTITGRLKDQFKTDKGKFVNPSPIEIRLLENKNVEQVCVVGSGIPQPIALINLSASGKEKSVTELIENLEKTVATLNLNLESFERISKVIVTNLDWTIENGLITPTLKVRRNEVEKLYQPFYPGWYADDKTIRWERNT